MSEPSNEHDKQLNEAIEEAFATLVDGMDMDAAVALWRRMCSDVFTYQLDSGDAAASRRVRGDGEREATARGCAVPRRAGAYTLTLSRLDAGR